MPADDPVAGPGPAAGTRAALSAEPKPADAPAVAFSWAKVAAGSPAKPPPRRPAAAAGKPPLTALVRSRPHEFRDISESETPSQISGLMSRV